jgi:hypothetical protein
MNATSKKTRIITRSRYSARIYRGKENTIVRPPRIQSQLAKPHLVVNALRTTRSTFAQVDRLLRRRFQNDSPKSRDNIRWGAIAALL